MFFTEKKKAHALALMFRVIDSKMKLPYCEARDEFLFPGTKILKNDSLEKILELNENLSTKIFEVENFPKILTDF